ncbi:lipoprotein BA_5634 family protein [Baia soyae]|uniref:Uncharacterized protein n=1 Tax=Baia soyae TaxID=1544746 RepID=A0A4R2RXU5_9BACL|nr:lipoprotein BA_5634 family protein [Baia soyae]TCP69376.1 hypothetical protein EDD57_10934 [Baia soyae]
MKKVTIIGSISFVVIVLCGYFFFKAPLQHVFGIENAAVVIGDQTQVEADIKQFKSDLVSSETFKVKIATVNEKKVLVMDKASADKLLKRGAWEKVEADNVTTNPIASLPAVSSETGSLFAKTKVDNLQLKSSSKGNVSYQGNVIIGGSRQFADMFAIVDPSVWVSVEGDEKTMGIFHFSELEWPKRSEVANITSASTFSTK